MTKRDMCPVIFINIIIENVLFMYPVVLRIVFYHFVNLIAFSSHNK